MKILLAEDDLTTRMFVGAALRKFGHETTATENGEVAWAALQRDDYPVIISDWLMPRLDGLGLCRRIRTDSARDNSVFILLTSQSGRENHLEALEAGIDDFIVKPFETGQLAARLSVAERQLNLRKRVRQLESLLPVCQECRKIHVDGDHWTTLDDYLDEQSDPVALEHRCPACAPRPLAEVA